TCAARGLARLAPPAISGEGRAWRPLAGADPRLDGSYQAALRRAVTGRHRPLQLLVTSVAFQGRNACLSPLTPVVGRNHQVLPYIGWACAVPSDWAGITPLRTTRIEQCASFVPSCRRCWCSLCSRCLQHLPGPRSRSVFPSTSRLRCSPSTSSRPSPAPDISG